MIYFDIITHIIIISYSSFVNGSTKFDIVKNTSSKDEN